MPVRTDTGRLSALRKALLWPLRSPKHAAVSAVLAVAVMGGLGTLAKAATGTADGEAAAPTSFVPKPAPAVVVTTPPSSAAPPVTPSTAPPTTPPPTSDPYAAPKPAPKSKSDQRPDPSPVAVGFVSKWVRPAPDTPKDAWMAQVIPYVAPEVRVELKSIDPQNVPSKTITGKAKTSAKSSSIAHVLVPTDGPKIDVKLLWQSDNRWLVTDWEPVGQG